MRKRTLFLQFTFYIPDAAILYLVYLFSGRGHSIADPAFIGGVAFCIGLKIVLHIWGFSYLFVRRIDVIRRYIDNLRHGRYAAADIEFFGGGYLADIYTDLAEMGRYMQNYTSEQREEIDKFRELYNNILFSASSYFIILNQRDEIIFVNKSFCSNFQFTQEELMGRTLGSVFLQVKPLLDAVESVRKRGQELILSQLRLLANNRFGIIADVKISRVNIQGEVQTIIVLDDITSKCRKDYQISLISQISESIQRDDEIDRVLYSILTAVTAGSGLGFNRAMLFLYDEASNEVVGKMAVGPDSVDEAVKIWGAVQGENVDMLTRMASYRPGEDRRASAFYTQVVSTRFPASSDNLIIRTMKSLKPVYVHDAWHDPSVDEEVRALLDVQEFVMVPLVAGNRALGVIIADNKYNHTPIWHDNVELLSIFAVQAALSIEGFNHLLMVREQMEKIQERQSAIVESEKMATVGRIAAHIAHEIRNPLVTMGGYARRILQIISKGSRNIDGIKTSAEVIGAEAERLEKFLSNVMDFTKPPSHIKEYHNINDVVTDTLQFLRNVLQDRKVAVLTTLAEDLPLVKCDFNQLKQVMLNLMQNAMEASGPDGRVSVETGLKDGRVFIAVRDTGAGIDSENMGRLFEPFFTTKVQGTGLGLAIVKKIINDHYGDISVRNLPVRGAEFNIEFPVG